MPRRCLSGLLVAVEREADAASALWHQHIRNAAATALHRDGLE
jgi:hypothetical protein